MAGADRWQPQIEDSTTITLATSTYIYTLPTDLVQLLEVEYRDDSTEPWKPIARDWRVAGTMGAQDLRLSERVSSQGKVWRKLLLHVHQMNGQECVLLGY